MDIVISNSGHARKPFLHKIKLVQGNIVDQEVDAIITVVPKNLEHVGSLNRAIFDAAGHKLDDFILENIYKPKVGDVYAVPGFNLKARHVLIGVMPYFRTDFDKSEHYLTNVTRKIMELARCMFLQKIAFPPIASGKNGYPRAKAARLIVHGIVDRLDSAIEEVRIVCPDSKSLIDFQHKLTTVGWDEQLRG
ncbi:MAG: macro domain-containing protein [Rhodospirillales bacterium]|nr:macro domain-containing protein [Alphaproteobacteria bacterium]MCB9976469.1 macro domain-containing protein [Rhodospirillales bacterium]